MYTASPTAWARSTIALRTGVGSSSATLSTPAIRVPRSTLMPWNSVANDASASSERSAA